jgi:pimeloyl-ACP methyl ester carboxylesterase
LVCEHEESERMNYPEYKAERKTVTTPHGEFAYVDVGDGPAVLFVHGLFVSAYMWHDVIAELSGEHRCVAYNLPHHGGSTVPDEQDLSVEANAEMLEGFCEAIGLERFDLVANDTGGAFAQALAVRRPELLRSLTLTNCEAKDQLPSSSDLAQMVNTLAEQGQLAPALKASYDDLDAARKGPFASLYQWPERFSDDDLYGILEPHQASVEAARQIERFTGDLDASQLIALEPQLRELEVPTICVWGTGDDIFPLELAHWLRDTIPGCNEVVEIDGGKLFWPFERGPELVSALRKHWAGLPSAA